MGERINPATRHPGTQAALRPFQWDHLPARLQVISRPFAELADQLVATLPDDPELTAALRKLREAKDCAVFLAAQTSEAT